MKTKILEELLDSVRVNGYHERSEELFAGAGIIVCKRKNGEQDRDILVISKHAAEISSIIFRLRDLCKEKLDYLNKYEFYGRLAESANKYIENYGDDLGVINSIIEEAIRIMKDWSRMYYFAYGSNMSKEQMSRRCPGAEFVKTIVLPDYKFALDCEGVATIIENAGSFVQGVLWLITEDDMDSLDKYEGVSSNCYAKEYIKVPKMHEDDVNSEYMLVYVSLRIVTPGNIRPGYMEKIVNAAKDWNFDENYITELEALMR